MKLINLNMWGGRLGFRLDEMLRREEPDLVCLQEAKDLNGTGGPDFITVDEVMTAFGAEHKFMSPTFSYNYMKRKVHFGNCIVSKLPIIKTETIFTGKAYDEDFDSSDNVGNIRNLQHATIELTDGRQIQVLNHHGHFVHGHKRGDEETMRQMKLIAEYIETLSGLIILCGDFNLEPDSESLEQINRRLMNLSTKFEIKTTRTPLTTLTQVCDYIFVNDQVKVNSFNSLDDVVSDHKALVLDFD